MKSWKIVTIITLAIVAASLLTATVYAYMGGGLGGMMGNYNYGGNYGNYAPNTGVAGNYGYEEGMMGNYNYGANTGVTGNYGYEEGMMGGYAPNTGVSGNYGGMMGGYGNYGGMMGEGYGYYPSTSTQIQPNTNYGAGCGRNGQEGSVYYPNGTIANSISINTAVTDAKNYLTGLNNPNLTLAHVEEYSQNFYALVTEKSTGVGAFELLINKVTGAISPEMGPNMMWNTKYQTAGEMAGEGGMMGGIGYTTTPTTTMPVSLTQAKANAQQFLTTNFAGTTVGDVTTFYGYYTIEILNSAGTTYGMLSVNGYSGQVWYHTWHGTFIQELTS